jgi:predicted nucleic acid-binding protein
VKVKPVTRQQLDAVTSELDLGERAAIALATALSANLLLVDDARGRAEARRRDLTVIGTLGVLRTAAERGLIDVPDVVARLRTTSFFVDDALIDELFSNWL